MHIELADCTNVILNEIADKRFKQKDIADTYGLSLISSEYTDYKTVNRAIVDRWSVSGLDRIKKMAWAMVEKHDWQLVEDMLQDAPDGAHGH